MRSLKEIGILEDAFICGAPTLVHAALALRERWNAGLRDQETFVRYAFLSWYSRSEPDFLTGFADGPELPTVDALYQQFGVENMAPETLFVLGLISHGWSFCCGDEKVWERRSIELFERAARQVPESAVFANWRFLLGLVDEPHGLRKVLAPELHARFSGRGYMGDYVLKICKASRRN